MSIPFYFAMEENETEPQDGKRYAQLGFGFNADGTLCLPERRIRHAAAVINDRFLPETAPDAAALDRLAVACGNGCFLDFERPINEVSAAIAIGLRRRLSVKMAVPPMLHAMIPDAYVQIAGQLCNHWERFARSAMERYGGSWVLEVVPWRVTMPSVRNSDEQGYLQKALCIYEIRDGSIRYDDTKESLREKLVIAEQYGCQAAIALYREIKGFITD